MRELEKILEEIEQRVDYYREHATLTYVDICAGLRTLNGDGEPCETCKKCYLYYGHQMWNEEDWNDR